MEILARSNFLGVMLASQGPVKPNAETKVGTLYCALPSSRPVLRRFGISIDVDADSTLSEIAVRRNFSLDELMLGLQGVSWEEDDSSPVS